MLDMPSIEDIQKGYFFNENRNSFVCNVCNKVFPMYEVFPIDGRFFTAEYAIQAHMMNEHSDYSQTIFSNNSKYNTLTANQQALFCLFQQGLSDNEIAKQTGVATSTIRHQKFAFREKAKQAIMYLALFQTAFELSAKKEDSIVPIHENATMVDERYIVTLKEKEQILAVAFTSLSPLQLKHFPRKEKKKLVVLSEIATCFSFDKHYSEKEINEILKSIFHDFVTLRRYLIEYGFMNRKNDGSEYWREK